MIEKDFQLEIGILIIQEYTVIPPSSIVLYVYIEIYYIILHENCPNTLYGICLKRGVHKFSRKPWEARVLMHFCYYSNKHANMEHRFQKSLL